MRAIKTLPPYKNLSLVTRESDAAVKEILVALNERYTFIIEDLDDHHVVIKADEEDRVRRELEVELEKNTYSLEA
ncbi:DNA-directed RNA polymerase subunit [Mycena kentingensis (nom. inval.)]|nr:DNA-directed RNA polymerase subunit [Mycena kentingensis (nom. inval.)]